MEFYEILQEIMDEQGLSITDVAKRSGLSDSTVRSIILRKQKKVALEVAFKLSDSLNVSLKRLNGEKIADDLTIQKDEIFAIKFKGQSMEPRIFDGDICMVKQQNSIADGEIGAVRYGGDQVSIKKIIKQENGILLVGLNGAAYSPRFFNDEEIEVIGKVIEVRGKMDSWNRVGEDNK